LSEGFRIVIPARFASSRFPGKALAELAGKPLLQHVFERAMESSATHVIVATDDDRIVSVARAFGAEVMLTRDDHVSGTDRIAEVARVCDWPGDTVVVNVQGDAPVLPATSIDRVAALLYEYPGAAIATLAARIEDERMLNDPNTVKVVADKAGRALYFSRAAIPAMGHGAEPAGALLGWRHIGLYAYRVDALQALTGTPPCMLEEHERLEQLRALWLGMEIRVGEVTEKHGPDVDTPEDLVEAARYIRSAGRG
jgi:3-deoxy-manno-octulosonate cytidylyltransferase (CMP-KDO synthetase)